MQLNCRLYNVPPVENLTSKEIYRAERFFENLLIGAETYDQKGRPIVIKEIKPHIFPGEKGYTVGLSITTESGKTVNIVPIHTKFKRRELPNLPQAIAKYVQSELENSLLISM